MTIGLILDGVVAILLGAVVWYCILLNHRLGNLRAGHEELSRLIGGLNRAISKAQDSVKSLKRTSIEALEELNRNVDAARAVRDELSFIIGSGNNLAERLEEKLTPAGNPLAGGLGDIRAARQEQERGTSTESNPADPSKQGEAELGETERQILKALSGAR